MAREIPNPIPWHWTAQDLAEELNAQADECMAESPNLLILKLVEDQDHWAQSGIFSGEQLAAYLDACAAEEERELSWYGDQQDRWNEPEPADPMPAEAGWFI